MKPQFIFIHNRFTVFQLYASHPVTKHWSLRTADSMNSMNCYCHEKILTSRHTEYTVNSNKFNLGILFATSLSIMNFCLQVAQRNEFSERESCSDPLPRHHKEWNLNRKGLKERGVWTIAIGPNQQSTFVSHKKFIPIFNKLNFFLIIWYSFPRFSGKYGHG